jgi:hypothetical protein
MNIKQEPQAPPPLPTTSQFRTCPYQSTRKRKEQLPGKVCGRRARYPYGDQNKLYCWAHYKHLLAHEKKENTPSNPLPIKVEEQQVVELPLSSPPPVTKKPRQENVETPTQQEKQEEDTEMTQPYDWVEEVISGNIWDELGDTIYESLFGTFS